MLCGVTADRCKSVASYGWEWCSYGCRLRYNAVAGSGRRWGVRCAYVGVERAAREPCGGGVWRCVLHTKWLMCSAAAAKNGVVAGAALRCGQLLRVVCGAEEGAVSAL